MVFRAYQNKTLSIIFTVVIAVAVVIGLQSCGGGGGSSAPGDQDASGLFKNGTASLDAGAVTPSDLRAFVYGGRIIMFSISSHILFDGQITSISSNDFTATVDLYETGVMTQADIPVTGKVTSQSSITGTLAGTDVGSGSFSLTFDLAYNTAATLERIRDKPAKWEGDLLSVYSSVGNTDYDSYEIYIVDTIAMRVSADTIFTESCIFDGTISIPNGNINIYTALQDISTANNPTLCTSLTVDPVVKYTGFAAVLSESSTDNDLLYAITNGTNSVFGLLSQP